MLAFWVVLAVVAGSIVVLLFQGAAILLAYTMPRLSPAPSGPTSPKRVSVVIAARNEELDLPATLDGLLAQDYPNLEIVVVDGGSTDGTRAVIDSRGPRVRRLDEGALPAGWVGKNWACWTGAQATSGEWLLFLDADVRTDPSAVRTVVDWAESEQADLASIAPTVEMVGFWEKTILPFYIQTILTYFRAPRVNRDTSHTAIANGQFFLVARSAYERVGGHAAVRAYVLEDIALARRLRDVGARLRMASAPTLARTRMYRDRHELFEGLLKNVHGGEFSALRMVGFLVGLVSLFLLPLLVLPFGWWEGSLGLTGLGAFLWIALFGKHVGFARGVGAPAAYGLLFPVAVGFYLVLVTTSLVRGVRRQPIAWKGRSYDLVGPGDANR
ncbi:MAG: glycosyltransferase [Thermoplasmata archaeon]